MITSSIGQKFLNLYNKEYQQNYSAKAFFEQEFIPLFFDYPVYMMKGGNAPLNNPKIKKGHFPDEKERSERITRTISKIENEPAASSPVGYPSDDLMATTSGQVTDMDLNITSEKVYLSWIGGALGIGVKGGLAIYFDHPKILLDTYKGWKYYRQLLEETKNMKGQQIETWNGQWLAHLYSNNFDPDNPLLNLDCLMNQNNVIQLATQSWTRLLFGIARQFSGINMTGYVYNLGQMNTTIGFIPFVLPEVNRPLKLYRKIFGENEYLDNTNKIESIFDNNYGLERACQLGAIGIQAIEPRDLKAYLVHRSKTPHFPKYKDADQDQIITFNTYITWILAMLNNEELLQKAEDAAKVLSQYEQTDKKGRAKTEKSNAVKSLLESRNRKNFIDNLIPLMETNNSDPGKLNELVQEINKMPAENFSYFLTLIRFKYAYIKNL